MTAARAAVVLLSGGLDSGVALALLGERGDRPVLCLGFDYGQRAAARELAAAAALARRFGAPFQSLPLPWLGDLARRAGSALCGGARGLPEGTESMPGDADSAAAVWVPARNAVFVAIAAAHAEALGAQLVVAGFNREEAQTFADNSAAFVAAADTLLAFGTRNGVTVDSPTLTLDKPAIAAAARRLGLGPADFWSCYRDGERPCGTCESCLRSGRAFRHADA